MSLLFLRDSDKENEMGTTRRDFLTVAGAAAAAGATATPDLAHAETHDHQDVPSDLALRTKSLESLLVEKGLVDPAALDVMVDAYEHKIGPRNGARVIARAWVDPAYKQRLLADGSAALKELGYGGTQGEDTLVVENTSRLHNLVVCTLCSCYPRMLLGLPPDWYKSRAYRSRAVREPRAVLAEFGTVLPEDVAVRVHDSTADMRYLVLPAQPPGTAGWSEERLAALVGRDAMIGVTRPVL
jgi:nitrile hydratase